MGWKACAILAYAVFMSIDLWVVSDLERDKWKGSEVRCRISGCCCSRWLSSLWHSPMFRDAIS